MDNEKVLYLTFDDGPNEPYTSQILEVLKQHGALATFFVCGKNIERSPQSIKNIVDGGHAIGIHTYSHNRYKVLTGDLMEEIELTHRLIKSNTGFGTRLYRSPWGITMPNISAKLKKAGYKIFHWDIMAFDWRQPQPEVMAKHIIGRAFDGAIVLLHDGDQTNSGSRKNTVAALNILLLELKRRGYVFKKVTEQTTPPRHKFKNLVLDNWLNLLDN